MQNATPLRTPQDARELFLNEQETIRAVVTWIARRHRLSPDQADDLASQVAMKLFEDDYLVLRKFAGRASLYTYLAVVVNRIVLDQRIAARGRWRASAAARREGRLGVLFEQLTIRRGLPFDDACTVLECNYGLTVDRQALRALADRLPIRGRRNVVGVEEIEGLPAADANPESLCVAKERAAAVTHSNHTLASALKSLPSMDQRVIHRRFFDNVPLARVAAELSLDAPSLYRRLPRLLKLLRRNLEDRGVTCLHVRELFRTEEPG
jgi:RNA polymerase sigma factor (sigma-70 family)